MFVCIIISVLIKKYESIYSVFVRNRFDFSPLSHVKLTLDKPNAPEIFAYY